MLQRLRIAFLLLLPVFSGTADAKAWKAGEVPMVHLKDARRYVCNPDGVLTQAAVDSTDAVLFRLEQERGVQTLVVVVNRLDGGDCYSFGMELGRAHGVGSGKQHTGLILVVSAQDRCYQILTGRGLEGALPDAVCRRIETSRMLPFLREGNWDAAVLESVKAIYACLHGDTSLLAERRDVPPGDDVSRLLALFIVAVVALLLGIKGFRQHRKKRCPRCKKAQLAPQGTVKPKAGQGRRLVTYVCPHCGYTEVREEDDPNQPTGGGILPLFFPTGGRRGGGGGGFGGGGSFGGGNFGGGGSGGKF